MNQKFESYSLRSTSQSFIWCPLELAVCSMQFATFHAKYFELSPNLLARCPPSVTETSSKRLKGWKAAKERRLLYNRSHRVPLWAWFARWISWMPAIHGFGESVKRVVVYLCVFVQDRTPGRGPSAPAAFHTELPPPVKDSSCSDCGSVQSPLRQQCQPLIHQTAPSTSAHSLGRSLHVGPLIHSPPVSPCNTRPVSSFFPTSDSVLDHMQSINDAFCYHWMSGMMWTMGKCMFAARRALLCVLSDNVSMGEGAGMVSGRTRLTTSSPTQNLCHRYFGIMRV